eukprot:GEMP01039806.1.p1 GENE.GEMP01039806.1~~GEMP01039806.1.p1  ORF type:complete len:416 (+),score=85.77 GEMP01039806.1:58-1305(+)
MRTKADAYIFFKFASGGAQERIPCVGQEMLISDLKTAISEKKKLPRWDLSISNADTGKVFENESDVVLKNSNVLVCRIPLLSKKKTQVISSSALRSDAIIRVEPDNVKFKALEVIHRRAFPTEYLCPLCSKPFNNPLIRTCCGKSACSTCLETAITDHCLLCQSSESASQIPNLRLHESVQSLDLRFYFLPGEDNAPVTTFFDPPVTARTADTAKAEDTIKKEDPAVYALFPDASPATSSSRQTASRPPIQPPVFSIVVPATSSSTKVAPKRECMEAIIDEVIDIDDAAPMKSEDVKAEIDEVIDIEDDAPVKSENVKVEKVATIVKCEANVAKTIPEVIDVESCAEDAEQLCAAQLRMLQQQAWMVYWDMQAKSEKKKRRRKESNGAKLKEEPTSKRIATDIIEINEDTVTSCP